MLAIERCAWLRSRRVKDAALLTRPARRAVLKASGRGTSRPNRRQRRLRRASNKELLKEELIAELPTCWQFRILVFVMTTRTFRGWCVSPIAENE
jgi:hypothetical protein